MEEKAAKKAAKKAKKNHEADKPDAEMMTVILSQAR